MHKIMSESILINQRRMMFKIGLGIVVCIAVYKYYAVDQYYIPKKYKGLLGKMERQKFELQIPEQAAHNNRYTRWKDSIHICVVAGGNRVEEALAMLKSAALFTQTHLIFHIFTEPELKRTFQKQLYLWPPMYREKMEYKLYNITFPDTNDVKQEVWKKLLKPCSCQRLFWPLLLTDVDSLLYIDTDVLILSPLEEIWKLFREFNSTQLACITREHEVGNKGWYNLIAKHPFYGETEQLYVISCEMHYRSDYCNGTSVCKPAEKSRAYIVHGNRRVWVKNTEPAFKAVYTAYKEHNLENSIKQRLLPSLNLYLKKAETSNCRK